MLFKEVYMNNRLKLYNTRVTIRLDKKEKKILNQIKKDFRAKLTLNKVHTTKT